MANRDAWDFATHQNNPELTKTSKIQKRLKPPKLPLPVKRLSDERSIDAKRATSSFCEEGNPWTKYKQLAKEGKPDKTCLAYDYNSPGSIVAIKQHSISEASVVRHLHSENKSSKSAGCIR